ncbi:GGDEF domain-containing protein [Streptomyces anulatus]
MNYGVRILGRNPPRTLLITTSAVLLTGWVVHAAVLHKRLAASSRDPLTGLLRRDAYIARAHRLLARHGDDTIVVMVDADRFKQINDGMGHAAGDAVLASMGVRLTAWAGPRAAVGRLGGDEFAIVLELPADRRAFRLEQLVRMLRTPVTLDDGRIVNVAASVGAATPASVGSRELTMLQRAADAALYAGKHSGRAVLATAQHRRVPSINGRRAGRSGTSVWGEPCPPDTAANNNTEESSQ